MSPYEQWVALLTLMRKEIRRYTRIWSQTLLPSAITMSLYFLIFGSLIGSESAKWAVSAYMEFVVPGLIMMAIVTNLTPTWCRLFSALNSITVSKNCWCRRRRITSFCWGFVSGGVSRGMLVAVIVTLVSSLFVDLAIHSYAVVVRLWH